MLFVTETVNIKFFLPEQESHNLFDANEIFVPRDVKY